MIFDDGTITRLLGSIEASNLALLCGAGLSIPPPSNLMSAVTVSRACYDQYRPIAVLPDAMRDDIDQLAGHFHSTHEFQTVFVGSLVPWNDLVGEPNKGHTAIADLLICRAAAAALSANFDRLIEQSAHGGKIAMRGALTGQEAVQFSSDFNPLLKFHGCLIRNREETLWTNGQLTEATIAARIASCSAWIENSLPGKDLLVIGFWTDWGYLNDVLANTLRAKAFGSVTVIDPAASGTLQAKAPLLWDTLSTGTAHFRHLAGSGADALEELRAAFSKVWLRRFYALGGPLIEADGKPYVAVEPDMICGDLYRSRCDAEGVSYSRAATLKNPAPQAAAAAFFHLLLLHAGATRNGSFYEHGGRRIRVVHAAGQDINTVKQRYKEPPAAAEPDIVVCAGALDLRAPGRIIPSGSAASVVRPAMGGSANWLTIEQARGALAL